MTDYQKLADRCVRAEIGQKTDRIERTHAIEHSALSAKGFCHDWRVVGAAMEKCSSIEVYWDDVGWTCSVVVGHGEHMKYGSSPDGYARLDQPIAILTATLDALEAEDD